MAKNYSDTKRIIILGGGFAGLWAAKTFGKRDGYQVTVIDRNNYHIFQPLLYQVASAGLEPEQITYPLRGTFRKFPNVDFRMAEITGLDLENKVLQSDVGPIEYDGLIVALGTVTHYFGVPGAEEYGFSLKNAEEAINIRNHILSCFEYAQYEDDPEIRKELLTFCIVGGGPTGVEYAGALAELINNSLRRDFKSLQKEEVHISLIEGKDLPLRGYPDSLRKYTKEKLEHLGVKSRYHSHVVGVSENSVSLKDGTVIPSRTVLWTAGIGGNEVAQEMGLPLGRANRVVTLPTLQLEEYPEVFVAGDLALPMDGDDPLEAPTVAPNAVQQGVHAAQNMMKYFEEAPLKPFKYFDKGSLATIGRSRAVVHLGIFNFTGWIAWVVWLFVHLLYLIGFRNRVMVLLSWTWEYIAFERGVRLILPKAKDTIPHSKADEYSPQSTEGEALSEHTTKKT